MTAKLPSHFELNADLNLFDENGKLQLHKDREASRTYFRNVINQNTVYFHSLEEKLEYLVEQDYYEPELLALFKPDFIKRLFKHAYDKQYRFSSFFGAYKFYTGYALKTFDDARYLERFEDRVCMTALYHARGDETLAMSLVDEILSGRYQPATPTILNAGRKQRGEMVSCFLLRIEDNMNSIGRAVNAALQLSKRGGGVAFLLTNLRETGAPIKKVENRGSGIIPVMKILEDTFTYANQLGSRSGAGAVYLNAHHPDILQFLDTKRENADEKVRIKTLSLGVVIPDITFEISKRNGDMYLFSPYDVERVYGKPMGDINITEHYHDMVDNPEITKTKINARLFFERIAELQFESGYPYIMYEGNVNRGNPNEGWINMSNLCTEILQVNTPSEYDEDLGYQEVGKDISCNLGSMNVAKAMEGGDIGQTVNVAVRALTSVSEQSNIGCVPPINKGNQDSRAIGLGQMNLHGFFAKHHIPYGSPDSLEFTNLYFMTVAYHAYRASNQLAIETGSPYAGFETSKYATGEYFDQYVEESFTFSSPRIKAIFEEYGIELPTLEEWTDLRDSVRTFGLYNSNLQAVPPTGSISYINYSTASIHPVAAAIEVRKEGKTGRVYYPAPFLTDENLPLYEDAYAIGPEKIIDVYAEAGKHVDQGLSLTLFFSDEATTRDITKAQIYAWRKGIKTLYYSRIRQAALEGTEVEGCVSCSL